MMKETDSAEANEHKNAVEWAHTVQARHAEHIMGKLARSSDGSPLDPVYRNRLVEAAIEGGIDRETAEALVDRPALEKVSEFDEPGVRHAAATFVDMLVKTMRDATMSVGGRRLLVSSLASGQINAICAAPGWDPSHYHVFVDPDLLVFCNSIGKLFAECLTRDHVVGNEINLEIAGIERNALRADIQERAADLYCSIVLKGTPRGSRPWLPSPEAYQLSQRLTLALNLFPIAHELGHLHHGHVEADDTRHVQVVGLNDVLAAVYSREDEFTADATGSVVAMQTMIRLQISDVFNCLAPYIFLKSVETLDVCFELFGNHAGEMSFTHPSATDRARAMRDVIGLHLSYHRSAGLYPQALRVIDRICHWFLVSAVANLNRLKAEGHRPRERVRLTVAEYDEQVQARWDAANAP